MFNRSPFNNTAFNRPTTTDVIMSVSFDGAAEAAFTGNADFTSSVVITGEGEMTAVFVREIYPRATMDGEGAFTAQFVREIYPAVTMPGLAEMKAKATFTHVDELHFLGDFKPGDKIVMDSKNLTVTLNGQNALQMVEGDLLDLVLGKNLITYKDAESSRTIQMQITRRDKFV